MPTPNTTVGEVLELAAALLNDQARQLYTDANMLPYLKIALKDLREQYELNNIPVTNAADTTITVTAGVTRIGFDTTPALPNDLIEIQALYESTLGTNNFTPVTHKDYVFSVNPVNSFGVYAWRQNSIHLPAATADIDLRIGYIAQIFRSIVDANSELGAINAESYLHYRTAALCAFYIGENKTRSDDLNGEGQLAFDRAMGIGTKAKQDIATRRRPFRSNYKTRGSR